jgi:Na+/H+ antiporter NhaD/arsenite permease-like protein
MIVQKFKKWIHSETVLFISAAFAVLSMIFVPPSADYIEYIDLRVLGLLFCLMTVVGGFHETGVFTVLSRKLLSKVRTTRSLIFVLVMLCFFSSMWITNDVALLTFVPFAVMILEMTGYNRYLIFVVVLQTIAANLGSMLTPVGNPQNLLLYSYFGLSINEFLMITFPCTLISLLLLIIFLIVVKKEPIQFTLPEAAPKKKHNQLYIGLFVVLFIISLLTVLHLIDYRITVLLVFVSVLFLDRKALKKVDYSLLLTFVCFFILVGNIGNITTVKDFLVDYLYQRELIASLILSQGISNVPAAALLSAFTDNYQGLILGTDIGGLGTLVASLASLISYKLYCRTNNAKPLKYLGVFTVYNIIFLVILLIFSFLVY